MTPLLTLWLLVSMPAASPEAEAPVVLWAWERPEDLGFLEGFLDRDAGPTVGVAPLLATVRISSAGVDLRGRRQPLTVPRGVELTAVVRIESAPDDPPELGDPTRERKAKEKALAEEIAGRILDAVDEASVRALQIDFDARRSERDFYRALLHELRRRLRPSTALEITALASWCAGDPWIRDLPVTAAVPMLFRMGRDAPAIRSRWSDDGSWIELCRRAWGVSTDEPWPPRPARRRVFVFHPDPWTAEAFARVRARLGDSP